MGVAPVGGTAMNVRKLLTVAAAALLVSAGAGAAAAGTGGTNASAATDADLDEYDADASYDNGTVTFEVTANGSGVEGLDVAVDEEPVGTTDADGRITFETNASEFTVTVTGENVTGEFVYSVENDSLTLEEGEFSYADEGDDEEENETRGPPSEMPEQADERVENIHAVINAYLDGDLNKNTTLGEALHDVASGEKSPEDVGAPEDRGRPDDIGPSDEDADDEDADDEDEEDDRGRPDDAGPPEDVHDEDDDTDDEDDDDDDEDDEDDDDDDEDDDRGNGNGRP